MGNFSNLIQFQNMTNQTDPSPERVAHASQIARMNPIKMQDSYEQTNQNHKSPPRRATSLNMDNDDIDGAKPKPLYRAVNIKDARLEVKDINSMDNNKRFLYKRVVDPLNPTYLVPDVNSDSSKTKVLGPIDGQRPAQRHKDINDSNRHNTTVDIPGASPKVRGLHFHQPDTATPTLKYLNRNKMANGDIIGLSNESPMRQNAQQSPVLRRQF